MECNKDEAVRAREIAEKKMQNSDFAAAKIFALKAQQLYANVDNISMILAVCEVHCSAQNKITGSGVNLYDVLQVEKIADEITIKKQYRKLALLLHPDKNKFAGAEAAFKLITEANRVLSNKMTRSIFDSQVRASTQTSISAKPPFCPSGGSSSVNKQQNSEDKGRQQDSHMFRQGVEKFWTRCPSCKTSYEYFKHVLRKQLACQYCKVTFIAYETEAPIKRSNANTSQSEFSGKGNSSSHTGAEASGRTKSDGHSVHNSMRAPPAKAESSDKKFNKKSNDIGGVKLDVHKKGQKSNERKPVKSVASGNTSKKRGRQGVAESSQSSGGLGDVDVRAEVDKESNSAKQESTSDAKRPSRNKRNAPHSESSYDGSKFAESPKLQETMCSDNNKEAHMGKGSKNGHINGTSYTENVTIKKRRLEKESFNCVKENNVSTFEENDMETEIAPAIYSDCYDGPEIPDQEFYDFDKDKEKNCFAVGQIWAVYDPDDAMPRYYAQIHKVYKPSFKLEIKWLESDMDGESKSISKWIKEGLPTACGVFVHGDTEVTTEYLMFSHQMQFQTREQSFEIHPRSGEVWALFKNWDICWADDPKSHKNYKFDFVVVLSNFDKEKGVEVSYLKKIEGFVSLFQQTTQGGRTSLWIHPGNLLQFSHRVPHFKLSGNEREDVRVGYYELDAASLPGDFDEREMDKEKRDAAAAAAASVGKSKGIKEEFNEEQKTHSSGKKSRCVNDYYNVESVKNKQKETSEMCGRRNPAATLVRRSPRVSKKPNNQNVAA